MPSRPAARTLRVAFVATWLSSALGAAWWMSGSVPAPLQGREAGARAVRAAAPVVPTGPTTPLASRAVGAGVANAEADRARLAWRLDVLGRHADAWAVASRLPVRAAHLELLAFTAGWAGADAQAATLLPEWLETHPRDASAWALLAEVARRRGDTGTRTRALTALTKLEGADRAAYVTLARHLAETGSTEDASRIYESAMASGSPDRQAIAEWALLLEQQGRFRAALSAHARLDVMRPPSAEDLVRQARLWRWAGEPVAALDAWARAMALDSGLAQNRELQADRARALAATGRWDDASRALDVALRAPGPNGSASASGWSDADLLRVAAEVATRRGEPARAVAHLQALSAQRGLSVDEQRWLIGQAEEARMYAVALAEYDRLLTASPSTPGLWEKVAELEGVQGHDQAALDAWRQVPAARRDAAYWRKITWTAARVSAEATTMAYADAYSSGHADPELWLEAARFHAAAGHLQDATTWYQRYLAVPNVITSGLDAELARMAMANGAASEALGWARRARAARPADAGMAFLEAQALHMMGQPREAAAILTSLMQGPTAPASAVGEWLGWLGRTSQSRGRLLEAEQHYAAALSHGVTPAGELWMARGDIANGRGDLRRAAAHYAEAARAGQEGTQGRVRAIDAQRRPMVGLPVEVFSDSNGFRQASVGGRLALRPSDAARVTGEWSSGRVSQGPTSFNRTAGALVVDRVRPTVRTSVGGQIGIEQARNATQPLWRVHGGYESPGGQGVQVETFRESPWQADTWDARMRYNRITDLSAMPGDFHATGVKVSGSVPVRERQEIQGNAAVRHFSDGNRQVQAYAQYQLPISTNQATWIAIQPYGYVEQWQRPATAYFSPETQATLGATVRAIVRRGKWLADGSATPQYLASADHVGFGYAVVGTVRRDAGAVSIGATGMLFDDRRMGYRVQRLTFDVQVPVGR